MSLMITTNVHCDGEGCKNWVQGVTDEVVKSTDARKVTGAKGWRFVRMNGRYVDLCPSCVKTYRIAEPRRR